MNQSHPAVPYIHAFLNSVIEKDKAAHAETFAINQPFTDILPGGIRIDSSKELIEGHDAFFKSSVTKFSHGPLIDIIADESNFSAGIIATVTKETGETVQIYIRLLFVPEPGTDRWVPRFLQNTVISEKDLVLKP